MAPRDETPSVVGLVPRRLTTAKRLKFPSHSPAIRAALEWQQLGAHAEFWGMGGQPERMYEIAAIMAAAGEQLGLAALADHEAMCWDALKRAKNRDQQVEREMATRAVVELQGYFVLATGHILANLAARLFALDRRLLPRLKKKLGTEYFPGASDRQSWSSLSAVVTELPHIAKQVDDPDLLPVASCIGELYNDPHWAALETLRGEEFHQWRPQTVGVRGARKTVFGEDLPAGGRVYSFSGGTVLGPEVGARLANENWRITRAAFELLPSTMVRLERSMEPLLERLTRMRFKRAPEGSS